MRIDEERDVNGVLRVEVTYTDTTKTTKTYDENGELTDTVVVDYAPEFEPEPAISDVVEQDGEVKEQTVTVGGISTKQYYEDGELKKEIRL